MDVISAGWQLTVVPDVSGEIFRDWLPGGFSPLLHARERHFRSGYAS
jgi:hypothetical protein